MPAITSADPQLFSSNRGEWRTPKALYELLVTQARRFDVSDRHDGTFDAFRDEWPAHWFANPPYGKEIIRWVAKMNSAGPGVALIHARTDTRWAQEFVLPFAEVEFIRGRLHFDDKAPAPFPSILAWFNGEQGSYPGACVRMKRIEIIHL